MKSIKRTVVKKVKAWAVRDSEGVFIVPAQCEKGDIEPFAIFRLKADAEDYASDFHEWHLPIKIVRIHLPTPNNNKKK